MLDSTTLICFDRHLLPDLGKAVGSSVAIFGCYERGEVTPSFEVAHKPGDAFGVTLNESADSFLAMLEGASARSSSDSRQGRGHGPRCGAPPATGCQQRREILKHPSDRPAGFSYS